MQSSKKQIRHNDGRITMDEVRKSVFLWTQEPFLSRNDATQEEGGETDGSRVQVLDCTHDQPSRSATQPNITCFHNKKHESNAALELRRIGARQAWPSSRGIAPSVLVMSDAKMTIMCVVQDACMFKDRKSQALSISY
eukprot:1146809-Pelagomonas_calceolata.AAC.8